MNKYKYILKLFVNAIKTVLSKPLFYLLLLFTVLCLMVIPAARMEISNIKVTKNGKTENIKLPYSADMASNEAFFISYDLLVEDKKNAMFNVMPNDCIQEILINDKKFPLNNIQGLCNSSGVYLDFSKYVQEGLNHFEFRIVNISGQGGLWVEIPYSIFKSLSPMEYIFIVLFLFFIILILIKLHTIKLNQETVYACVLSFPFVLYAFVEFCIRINYELSGIYQIWDAPVYYAIGRGIVNGIAPWSGLFEAKPPGMFLVSAFSFKFFSDQVFTYYSQVFVLILTAAIPIAAYFLLSNYRSALKFALSMLAGLLLALYSAERSGEFQVESFGAAFACLAVLAMAVPDFEKRKVLWISLSTIGILGACGFREPFLLSLCGVSLIFCKGIKDWLYRFALPSGIALFIGFAFLWTCGWLVDFLHYIGFMFFSLISKQGSSFGRAMEFYRIYSDLNSFSRGFSIALLILLFLPFLKFFGKSRTNEEILYAEMVFFGIAVYFNSYAVGLSGEFIEHNFILALPFYMALFLLLLKNWVGDSFSVSKLGSLCLVFLVIGTIDLPYRFDRNLKEFPNHFHSHFGERTRQLNDNAKDFREAAAYLDFKMDEFGIDRYVFIGSYIPNSQIYGWTRHSPVGPHFFKPLQWFGLSAGDSLISNIEKSDAVVIGNMPYELGPKTDSIYRILNYQFTRRQINKFQIYFRKDEAEQ